ncbi:MAG: hypothetical protein M1818_001101 [Claussenomyces sp. TS43310]|nr:MAG: hypothetical protein M1818_001101 [Claussenomyces sp. TS43310]
MTTQLGLTIYPSYCHGVSPTLGKWCPLRSTDVHGLKQLHGYEGQDIYFYLNHPIKWIRIAGVVVAIDEFSSRIVFTVDDSSGTNIEATCAPPPKNIPDPAPMDHSIQSEHCSDTLVKTQQLVSPDGPVLADIEVGSVVKIRGRIGIYRDQKQLQLVGPKGMTMLRDTNEEVMCWNDALKFKADVLARPWKVTEEEEKKCLEGQTREMIWRKEEEEKKRRRELRIQISEKGKEMEGKRKRHMGQGRMQHDRNPQMDHNSKRKSEKAGLDECHSKSPTKQSSIAPRRQAPKDYDTLGFG